MVPLSDFSVNGRPSTEGRPSIPFSPEEGLEIADLRLALISLAAKSAYPQLSLADFDWAEKVARRLNRTQDPVEFF